MFKTSQPISDAQQEGVTYGNISRLRSAHREHHRPDYLVAQRPAALGRRLKKKYRNPAACLPAVACFPAKAGTLGPIQPLMRAPCSTATHPARLLRSGSDWPLLLRVGRRRNRDLQMQVPGRRVDHSNRASTTVTLSAAVVARRLEGPRRDFYEAR